MSEWQETDFGRIPREWGLKKIADIKSDEKRAIAMGPFGSNIKAENFVEHGVPVIRGTNFNFAKYVGGDFVYLTEEKADDLLGSNCKAGDIVFTHRGTIGQVGLIPTGKFPRYVISQSGMKLTVNSDLMDSDFLFYFFKSEFGQHQILKYESQVGVPSISNPLTSLKEIKVPAPCLPEQKSIAAVLSSLDDKIDLLHRQNQTLEAMAETLFRQWFVEEVQEDWEEVPIGSLFKISSGKGIKKEQLADDGLFPVLGANGEIGRTNDYLFDEKLIFTGRVGTVGNIFIVDGKRVWLSDNTLVFSKIHWFYFVYFALKTARLAGYNAGSTQPLIRQSDIKKIPLSLPNEIRLCEFEEYANEVFRKIEANSKQIRTLENLRNTVLPKLMSGEVRVAC